MSNIQPMSTYEGKGNKRREGKGEGEVENQVFFLCSVCTMDTDYTCFKVTVKTFDMINELFIENVKSKNLLDKKEYKK